MNSLLYFLLILTFVILSSIHWSWVLGSKWGLEESLPTNEKGERVLNPGKSDGAVVAVGLLFFAVYYVLRAEIVPVELPGWLFNYGGWIISSIFLLRAIGDTKYIGFFKRLRNTAFARLDTKYYSPLCLLIAIMAILPEL